MIKTVHTLKYFSLAMALLFSEQLPMAFIVVAQPFWQSGLITLFLLFIAILTVYVAKRIGLLNYLVVLKTWKAWKSILIGFLALTVVKYIGGVILLLENSLGTNTESQVALEQIVRSPLLLVVLTTITAPIVEETVMRGLILGRIFHNPYFGVTLVLFYLDYCICRLISVVG